MSQEQQDGVSRGQFLFDNCTCVFIFGHNKRNNGKAKCSWRLGRDSVVTRPRPKTQSTTRRLTTRRRTFAIWRHYIWIKQRQIATDERTTNYD
ncbi:hypothetical protein ACLKA7_016442 [Drosophila subpalustris]